MNPRWDDLLRGLREPAAMARFDLDTWDRVARQAASAGLLGRLAALAQDAGIVERLPAPVWRPMRSALTVAEQQQRAVRWELTLLSRTLAELDGPVLLLKGAAYAAADLAPSRGRVFSDIDLLVPRSQIDLAESALMLDGWVGNHRNAYDQRYYRQWMHELPPMTHIRRQTVLDLHHSILPLTARIRTPPGPILASASRLDAFPRFSIPAPVDLALHSATHLFHEGEWQHGLRDLVDLDAMLRDFGRDDRFFDALVERAARLNLGRPLFYGLRYCRRLLGTPLPAGLELRCDARPSPGAAALLDRLFVPALATAHPGSRGATSGAAQFALFVRSHWLRMPLHLLLPHLARKAWLAQTERFSQRQDPGPQP